MKRKANKKATGGTTGRAKPIAAKAGFTKARRRYEGGGKQAMLEAYKVDDKGEKPAYTIGYLTSKMWKALPLIMQEPYKS